jgi:hypothetical protein
MLLVCLALVGGTGCITAAVVDNVRAQKAAREREHERLQGIAALTPRAEAGDLDAMKSLAQLLLAAEEGRNIDMPRALAWLSRSADRGDALSQALLGDLLAPGSVQPARAWMPAAQRDRDRGIALLQKAAVQACRYWAPSEAGLYQATVEPAQRLGEIYRLDHLDAAARLWHARSVVHCGAPNLLSLYDSFNRAHTTAERQEGFAMLLLSGSDDDIERARKTNELTPEQLAEAERQAAELRRIVAASEQQYPVPARKSAR